jgi:uncharacterized protein (TIGR02453 family)
MNQTMAEISPHFIVSTKKIGGSLKRIHKDMRFTKDKTPYKTNIGIHFKHVHGKDVHAPGFYLHIEPAGVFISARIWRPATSTQSNIRTLIDESPNGWNKITSNITGKDGFQLDGSSLKRPPAGFTKDHVLIEDLKRKDYIAVKNLMASAVYAKNFDKKNSKTIYGSFTIVKFICAADDLPF